jgi:hypothetical protein
MNHIHKYTHTKYPTVMLYGIRFTGYHKVVAVHYKQFVVRHLKKKNYIKTRIANYSIHIILCCNKTEVYRTTFSLMFFPQFDRLSF